MKKLLFTLFVISCIFLYCSGTKPALIITDGVKVISKYCGNLSEDKSGNELNNEEYKTAESDKKTSPIPPFYFWDTKMMIR